MEGSFFVSTRLMAQYRTAISLLSTSYNKGKYNGIRIESLASKVNTMLTILLFIALLILCWVAYKSIDWFEKI